MAFTWTTLVVSDFDPEQPITTQKANAWYFNVHAFAEGASGAPKLEAAALQYSAGSQIIIFSDTERTTASLSYVKLKEISINAVGTLSIKFNLKQPDPGDLSYGRIYVNGIAVGTERSNNSATYITYSEDIAVNAGDLVQLYVKTSNAARPAYCANFRIYGSGAFGPYTTQD